MENAIAISVINMDNIERLLERLSKYLLWNKKEAR
jgi:hypothetical protein